MAQPLHPSTTAATPRSSVTLFGIPIGLVVLVIALGYLGTLWTKRVLRKA